MGLHNERGVEEDEKGGKKYLGGSDGDINGGGNNSARSHQRTPATTNHSQPHDAHS